MAKDHPQNDEYYKGLLSPRLISRTTLRELFCLALLLASSLSVYIKIMKGTKNILGLTAFCEIITHAFHLVKLSVFLSQPSTQNSKLLITCGLVASHVEKLKATNKSNRFIYILESWNHDCLVHCPITCGKKNYCSPKNHLFPHIS